MAEEIIIRLLNPQDDLEELTELLHRAYKRLADMGLRYVATYQDVTVTKRRIRTADCFVAEHEGRLVGTIAFHRPRPWTDRPTDYEQGKIAHFAQFGVDPEYQGKGLGSRMLEKVEDFARSLGLPQLAFDTSEKSKHLIEWYGKRGYRFLQYVDWEVTNYRSVVMIKDL